jgi:hypothetical protein
VSAQPPGTDPTQAAEESSEAADKQPVGSVGGVDEKGLAEAAETAARLTADREQVVGNVRGLAGLAAHEGPDDDHLYAGVREFVRALRPPLGGW